MKLTVKPMMMTAILALWAGAAQAAITVNDVVKSYQDAAYTNIEVKEGPTQIKVEAVKDGVKVEVIYDKATGSEVKRESEVSSDPTSPGVEVSVEDDDFSDEGHGHDGVDDDSSDDNGSGSGSDDDGSDDGADHDSGDDHGGSGHDDSGHDDGGADD